VTSEVEDKKMHMANRCILAQDQALYWADSEITYLRWKWDRCLQLAQEVELVKLDLADRLEQSHQRNGELVQLGLAAAKASAERDTVRIATLEARLKTAEEKHRATVEATRVDREKLAEAKYLMESVGAAAADYQVRVWDLQEGSQQNYNHLCYLGGLVYEERDRAARICTAWECSDQQRLRELEELSAQLPPKKSHDCKQRPLSYPLHFFHDYAHTQEVPRTQRRWTTLFRTLVTTTEDQRSGCRVTQEFTHHRSTLFHQTPAQRHPSAPRDESRVLSVDPEMS
jgi:hypothetical protein